MRPDTYAALPLALALLLVLAGVEDARRRAIANWKNAAVALLAPVWWWAQGLHPWPDVAAQLAVFAGVFALFLGAFAAGWMGGGDVKLIAALALWLPLGGMMGLLVTMSLLGGGLTLLLLAERLWRRGDGRGALRRRDRGRRAALPTAHRFLTSFGQEPRRSGRSALKGEVRHG